MASAERLSDAVAPPRPDEDRQAGEPEGTPPREPRLTLAHEREDMVARCDLCGLEQPVRRVVGHRDWLVMHNDLNLCAACRRTHAPLTSRHMIAAVVVAVMIWWGVISFLRWLWMIL